MTHKRIYFHYAFLLITCLLGIMYTSVNFYPDLPILEIKNVQTGQAASDEELRTILDTSSTKGKVHTSSDGSHRVLSFNSIDQQMLAKDEINQVHGERFVASPNLQANYPQWLRYLGAAPMKLGLDLRGGVHLTLNVDVENSPKDTKKLHLETIKQIQGMGIDYDKATAEKNGLLLSFSSEDQAQKAEVKLAESKHFKTKLNQNSIEVQVDSQASKGRQDYIMQRTLESIHRRVNELGLSEAIVQRQGATQINIDLPGIQDMQRAKDIIGNTATLSFHLVSSFNPNAPKAPSDFLLNDEDGRPMWLEQNSVLTGDAITHAIATHQDGKPLIQIQLNGGAAEASFYNTTMENKGKNLAIVYQETVTHPISKKRIVNRRVISAPSILNALRGSFVIQGIQSNGEAETLALLLRSGSLAAPIDIVHETTVGPSLGEDNIQKGVFSIGMGFAVVVVFMSLYYRTFGLIANIGLFYNLVLIVTCLSFLNATISLPSMAAIVLTVGMAVDANVLINERIREEIRLGASEDQAIAHGYDKAFATILDANVTTFIVSIVLYGLGSGMIKGFAVTLIIGLVCSMISAVYATRHVTQLLRPMINNLPKAIGI